MSQIYIELDNQLKQSNIIVPITNISKAELNSDVAIQNRVDVSETEVNGILSPLIEINNIVISFDKVIYFNLISEDILPEINLKVEDTNDLIKTFDSPKSDNQIRIQILPPFENAYKKINLTFFIDDINIDNSIISLSGIYKIPALYETRFTSFGQISTFDLCKKIAIDTKLGFATNIKATNDKRFIFCKNTSYLNLLKKQIQQSGSEQQILSCWIDLWNNINLIDIKERYEAIDKEEDMMVWITGQYDEVGEDRKRKPIYTGAILNNNPLSKASELYVESYEVKNETGQSIYDGTDKIECSWNMGENQEDNYLIMDGDIKKDIFIKHEYMGEVYGDFNYFKMQKCRKAFLQKINNNSIIVTLKTPMIALMRGQKVDFTWYNINDFLEIKRKKLDELGFINKNPKTNIPLNEKPQDEISSGGNFKLDKNVSGQYLITASRITFDDNEWSCYLTLNKPPLIGEGELIVPESENK